MESVRGTPWPRGVQPSAPGSRTTRLELFYDLVFVFAFLNVTTAVAGNPTLRGLVQGLLVLALLWWAWTGFAVLGNLVRTDQGVVPFVGFAATATAFVFALAMPKAFRDLPGGLPGPLVFAVCYFVIRISQVAVFGWMVRQERSRLRRFLPVVPVLAATGFLLIAAVLPQRFAEDRVEHVVRLALWFAAIGVEYGSGLVLPGTGWTVLSAGHWAERHALIVLVALGETIIALGIGPGFTAGLPLSWPIIIAALLGIAVVAALWWAYFDTLALASEQTLHRARVPRVRAALARDAYTYLHTVLVAGIILLALGLKGLLEEGADSSTPTWGLPLPGLDLLALYGGVALYLLGLVALGLRVLGTVRWPSVTAVVLLAVLVPLAAPLGEMLALSVLALATVVLVAVQTVVDAPLRRNVREVALREQVTAEADQTAWRGRHL
ncbi:low temperature requirement protein A [Micromonospora sp. WMMD558]|uniref:low temperature requirement protein A n=1 Tax=unclassified Micromonospora TaxID=2617518 RepID=UPI0012B4E4F4|nr:low temperature requirement protein A [Micromonospora sp. WMMC415]QGN47740.1 low temperature requirement protein A [Micromonospora sp. WMMC415]